MAFLFVARDSLTMMNRVFCCLNVFLNMTIVKVPTFRRCDKKWELLHIVFYEIHLLWLANGFHIIITL